jgi:hypothetical protein
MSVLCHGYISVRAIELTIRSKKKRPPSSAKFGPISNSTTGKESPMASQVMNIDIVPR